MDKWYTIPVTFIGILGIGLMKDYWDSIEVDENKLIPQEDNKKEPEPEPSPEPEQSLHDLIENKDNKEDGFNFINLLKSN